MPDITRGDAGVRGDAVDPPIVIRVCYQQTRIVGRAGLIALEFGDAGVGRVAYGREAGSKVHVKGDVQVSRGPLEIDIQILINRIVGRYRILRLAQPGTGW